MNISQKGKTNNQKVEREQRNLVVKTSLDFGGRILSEDFLNVIK
tara:strand:+ start:211 stop:342 length:132 start_codon:yes stop_codon:yes gene_type:complete